MPYNKDSLPEMLFLEHLKNYFHSFKKFCNSFPQRIPEINALPFTLRHIISIFFNSFVPCQTFKSAIIYFGKVIKKNRFNVGVEFYYFFKGFPCPPLWAAVNRINFFILQLPCNCPCLALSFIIQPRIFRALIALRGIPCSFAVPYKNEFHGIIA